jgi:hypothetical protein
LNHEGEEEKRETTKARRHEEDESALHSLGDLGVLVVKKIPAPQLREWGTALEWRALRRFSILGLGSSKRSSIVVL